MPATPPSAPSAEPDYRDELEEKLHLAYILVQRIDAPVWTLPVSLRETMDFLHALDDDILLLAQAVFVQATRDRARATPAPTTDERAAFLVAQWLHGRLTDPAHDSPPTTRQRQWQCCSYVWSCLAMGQSVDEALDAAAAEFARGRSWAARAFYGAPHEHFAGRRALLMQQTLLDSENAGDAEAGTEP